MSGTTLEDGDAMGRFLDDYCQCHGCAGCSEQGCGKPLPKRGMLHVSRFRVAGKDICAVCWAAPRIPPMPKIGVPLGQV